jgi:CBS domain-containing protein
MQVQRIMNREVKTCRPHEPLNTAAQIMCDTPCGAVPVVDEQGRPVGFFTHRDVCMAAYTQNKPLTELPVEGAMARKPVCCRAEDDLDSAARQHHSRRVPVVDRNGILVGLLTLDDLACEAARLLRGGRNNTLGSLVLEVLLSINRERVRLHPAE